MPNGNGILDGVVTLDEVKAALADVDQAEKAVELAQRMGFPVEDFRVRIRDSKEKFGKIRQVMFPGR